MKKIISIFAIITLLTLVIFTGNTYAAELDTLDITTSKTTVRPGEEITVRMEFGQSLGAYTFKVSYDNNIFDYVSSEGGTANDTTDKIIVTYHDTTGGTNPRTNMSVTFKAKADITTSNPTEFTITAEGLANADASVTFDDIGTPIVKNVTVEPEYVDYTLNLQYEGKIVKEEEKAITVSYSSPMGHYYEHARLVATATTPEGADIQLLATDNAGLEHDIIESGWGDAQGYKIGGKNVSQVLQTRGIFSKAGNYSITLKLIDRDNSDAIIAEKTFQIAVAETATPVEPPVTEPEKPEESKPEQTTPETTKPEQKPTTLPKTGVNIYVPIVLVIVSLLSCYIYYNKKK